MALSFRWGDDDDDDDDDDAPDPRSPVLALRFTASVVFGRWGTARMRLPPQLPPRPPVQVPPLAMAMAALALAPAVAAAALAAVSSRAASASISAIIASLATFASQRSRWALRSRHTAVADAGDDTQTFGFTYNLGTM